MALPGDDLDLGLRRDVAGEVFVRDHDDLGDAERLDDLLGVARGAADVALRLHRGRGVDIGDDRHAGMLGAQQPHICRGDQLGERASGFHVGDQHGLLGVQQLRRLGHEMDAGEHDHVGVGARRLARKRQAVADDVGHGVEDVRGLVVVREDDRVPLTLQLENRRDVLGKDRPLELRHMLFDPMVELGERQVRASPRGIGGGGRLQHGYLLILTLSIFKVWKSRTGGSSPSGAGLC